MAGVEEVHILWISEGMSCDGDTVSITAASQPSIEDVVLGVIPGLPKVHLHNKVLAYETGEDFLAAFFRAARAASWSRSSWWSRARSRTRRSTATATGPRSANDPRPASRSPLNEWIDQLAPQAWAVVAVGTCATYGGIHAMAGNPTGCMGLADYLGWDFRSKAGLPIVNVPRLPGAAGQLHGDATSGCSIRPPGTRR